MKPILYSLLLFCSAEIFAQNSAGTPLAFSGLGNETINSIKMDGNGNSIAIGSFNNSIDLDPSSAQDLKSSFGQNDAFLVKLDSLGNYLWGKQLGGPANDYGNAVVIDNQNNIYVSGIFEGTADFEDGPNASPLTSRGEFDVYLCKYSPQGQLIWTLQVGDSLKELSPFLAYGKDQMLYLSASFEGTIDFDPSSGIDTLGSSGQQDIFLLKLDTAGAYQWAKQLEGFDYQYSGGLASDASGNVYLTGSFVGQVDFNAGGNISNVLTSQSGTDIFLAKYDSTSELAWVHAFGSLGFEIGSSVLLDDQDNPILAGSFDNSIDFDPSSSTFNLTSNGSRDVVVAKYSPSGGLIWAKNAGGSGIDVSTDLSLGLAGEIYCSGRFSGTADFDPSSTQVIRNSYGNSDAFLWKLSAQGSFLEVIQAGGTKADQGNTVASTSNGNFVWAGSVLDSANFVDGMNTQKFICSDLEDAFVYGPLIQTVGIGEQVLNSVQIQVFPNPSNGNFSLQIDKPDKVQAQLINLQGKVLWSKLRLRNQEDIDLSLAAGIYFLQIIKGNEQINKKIIIQ